jgi:hypothetical protein
LPVVAILVALAATSNLPRNVAPLAGAACVLLALAAVYPSLSLAGSSAKWYQTNAGDEPFWQDRGTAVAENVRLNVPTTTQSPGLVRFVRSQIKEDDVLAYAITTYPTLLWNADFSNDIHYVPGSAADAYPVGPHALTPPGPREAAAWLRRLERLQPDFVVVYRNSDYPRLLMSTGDYRPVYEDPAGDGATAVTVMRRTAGTRASG